MKSKIYHIALGLAVITASCKKIDNYPAPTETLKGTITDVATGKNVQSEVSGDNGNGTRIKLLETSWSSNPTPLYLATMQDGTFNNTKVFAATYNISAEGAFVPLVQTDASGHTTVDQSQNVEVKGGTTTVNFKVEPFLNIEWVGDPVVAADGSITAQVKITRGTTNPAFQQNITDVFLYVNNTKYIGNNNYDTNYSLQTVYPGATGNAIVGTTLTLKTKGGALPAKRDYYVRVGARTDYGLKRYNYNEPKVVTVP
ncbi:DUF3823 domain-containing protein [Mucilaginibacter sp. AK015]|uniref:DUF3823 domain-containing protein n=1 Tax=Mucilaginibacter sp. AK015 TaxID=2723072 RepID=UPI00161161D5|nr:DUF3823 domain-containing protein [Mucilaginibacter sp. AK015]MBB5396116.1 hypothetical protein [Mucilaginibacter sp. AK015]